MKLLYLADRKCLGEESRTITGDRLSALPHGPVLSTVLGLIQGKDSQSERWEQYIKRGKNYIVYIANDPGTDELCRFEKEIIEEIFERYKDTTTQSLVDMTHQLPEWAKYEDALKNPSLKRSYKISIEDVLEGIGKPELLESVEEKIAEEKYYAELFGG